MSRVYSIILCLVATGAAGCGCGGGGGSSADRGTATDTGTGTDSGTDSGTGTDTDTGTGTDTDTDTDTDTEDQDTDTFLDGMRFWRGNLHSHTSYSDGQGTPAEGFAFARDAGLDFYAVTDHAENLNAWKWDDTGVQADLFEEPGVFSAIRGYEWSHPLFGHINVWDTEEYVSALSAVLLSTFYGYIDEAGALAQFNHPGREYLVFNNLALVPSVVENMVTIETGNKGTGNADGEFVPYFIQALDNGWRVAPASNQDNHSLSINRHRTVIIAPHLSREHLLEALAARRVYSSDDPDIEVVFRAGAAWMGEVLPAVGQTLSLDVRVTDDEPVLLLEILTDGGEVVAELAPEADQTEVEWHPQVNTAGRSYFFLRVTSADTAGDDGEVQVVLTAPIWMP